MNRPLFKKLFTGMAAFAAIAAIQFSANAQASLFSGLGDKLGAARKGSQQPTIIIADSMDIDIANNVATLIGNVDVDDVEMNIKCHKMVLYLIDVKPEDKDKGKDKDKDKEVKEGKEKEKEKTKPEDELGLEKSKQLSRIECIGDVVITRKVKILDPAAPKLEQKALAGRADYDLLTGKIVLTEDPVIFHGKNRVRGSTITIYRDSERAQIANAVIEATGNDEEKTSAPASEKPKTEQQPNNNPAGQSAR